MVPHESYGPLEYEAMRESSSRIGLAIETWDRDSVAFTGRDADEGLTEAQGESQR